MPGSGWARSPDCGVLVVLRPFAIGWPAVTLLGWLRAPALLSGVGGWVKSNCLATAVVRKFCPPARSDFGWWSLRFPPAPYSPPLSFLRGSGVSWQPEFRRTVSQVGVCPANCR